MRELNAILENYNEVGVLRIRVSSLKGKLEAMTLMVDEKEGCAREVASIQGRQRNEEEIQALMTSLREKKKDASAQHNKYCEGVAKKLEDRVKKLLRIYDYTFECAEGLDDLRARLLSHQADLTFTLRRLEELESGAGIDLYKKKFEENRKFL